MRTREAMGLPQSPADAALQNAMAFAKVRKDIWPSRQAAREWLARKAPWRAWDARALDLYVVRDHSPRSWQPACGLTVNGRQEYALRDLPTPTYPDRREGVTLATTREQEYAGYVYYEDGYSGLIRLRELCGVIPVHAVFGARNDIMYVPSVLMGKVENSPDIPRNP